MALKVNRTKLIFFNMSAGIRLNIDTLLSTFGLSSGAYWHKKLCVFSYHHQFADFEGMFNVIAILSNFVAFFFPSSSSSLPRAQSNQIQERFNVISVKKKRLPGKCEQANKHFLVRKLQNISSPAVRHNQV
jgi:hypothetical protein